MAALTLRLPNLEGKANKRERAAVNKELYCLANGEEYVAAVSEANQNRRLVAKQAEEEEWSAQLKKEATAAAAAHVHDDEWLDSFTARLHWRGQVEGLFDEYATTFESELCNGLQYRTPQAIEEVLLAHVNLRNSPDAGANVGGGAGPAEGASVTPDGAALPTSLLSKVLAADLGCGTGLAGVHLRRHCRGRLVGCDLSRKMVAQAAEKRSSDGAPLYDELCADDAISFLHSRVPAASADLIVAADVLVYIHDLDDLFQAVARSLLDGGLFAFSTEAAWEHEVAAPASTSPAAAEPSARRSLPRWVERASGRVAHFERYVRQAVDSTRVLKIVSFTEMTIRNDAAKPIRGHLVVCEKGATPR